MKKTKRRTGAAKENPRPKHKRNHDTPRTTKLTPKSLSEKRLEALQDYDPKC